MCPRDGARLIVRRPDFDTKPNRELEDRAMLLYIIVVVVVIMFAAFGWWALEDLLEHLE